LGWTTIRTEVVEAAGDAALLVEIDENLIRADLSPAEVAAHQHARKEVYERLHPETKHGGTRRDQVVNSATRYTADVAKQTGASERTIRREAERGAKIADVAALVGTSLDKGDELDALAKLTGPEQQQLAARAKAGEKVSAKVALKKAKRARREESLAAATAAAAAQLGQQLFGVLYADPPWRFEPYSRETGMDRAADNHYPTMTLDDIKALKVPAADGCVLFLWATAPMLEHALAVMKAWGFTYCTHAIWNKDKIGPGYWFRNKHEILLVGTCGNIPAPAQGDQYDSVIDAVRGEHSVKPDEFADMIKDMFPNVPKLEMFARGPRDRWTTWGNEAVPVIGSAPVATATLTATAAPVSQVEYRAEKATKQIASNIDDEAATARIAEIEAEIAEMNARGSYAKLAPHEKRRMNALQKEKDGLRQFEQAIDHRFIAEATP
jgi:N6-adenosine-specific RNA methylase IME4